MDQEGFDFLGFHFLKCYSNNSHKLVPYMWPSQKAMKSVRKKIHEITDRKWLCKTLQEIIKFLNPVIRGWRNYFRVGNSTKKLDQLDQYVWHQLWRWMRARKGSRGHWNERVFDAIMAHGGLEDFYQNGKCVNSWKPQEEGCRRAGWGKTSCPVRCGRGWKPDMVMVLRHSRRKQGDNELPNLNPGAIPWPYLEVCFSGCEDHQNGTICGDEALGKISVSRCV